MAIVLDEASRAEYLAQTVASTRATNLVAALTGTVTVEIRDGRDTLMASGTMAPPWASASGATITIGDVTPVGLTVTTGGTPDALWYCQFKAGSRFVRGTFGLPGSGSDFVWSLAAFQTGSRGTIGTAVLTASGAPENTAAPAVSGTPQVGQTLTVTTGTWTGSPTSYAYQWQRSLDGSTGWTNIGTNAATYVVASGELGQFVRCVVTATNGAGSGSANSGISGPMAAAGAEDPLAGWQGGAGLPVITRATSLPEATIGVPYSCQLTYNGTNPVTWSLIPVAYDRSTSEVPTEITITSGGKLTGTPTTGRDYQFIVKAVNSVGSNVVMRSDGIKYDATSGHFRLRVNPKPATIIQDDIWFAIIGEAYSQQFSANASAPVVWSASGLPTGMSIDSSTGLLSASAVAGSAGDSTITITATANGAAAVSKQYKLTTKAKTASRIHKSDLTYLGAFTLPDNDFLYLAGSAGRGSGIAPTTRGTIYVGGRRITGGGHGPMLVSEYSLPGWGTAGPLTSLPVAPVVQAWADASDGNTALFTPGGETSVCAVHWEAGTLIVSGGYFYDSSGSGYKTFKRSDSLSATGTFVGPCGIRAADTTPTTNFRRFMGYLTGVPAAARTAYGIPSIMIGGKVGSLKSIMSVGPSAALFNAADITGTSPIVATKALEYPWISTDNLSRGLPYLFSHPGVANLISDTHQNKWWTHENTQCNGAVWINNGTRKAVIFFATQSMGAPWYGAYIRNGDGGSTVTEGGAFVNGSEAYKGDFQRLVRDQQSNSQGGHGYPYRLVAIAYDESEIAAVINGTKNPWEAVPYDAWPITYLLDPGDTCDLHGVGHDMVNRIIYVSISSQKYGVYPVIHGFQYPAS